MNVLVVDDDASFALGLAQSIRMPGACQIHVAHSFEQACQMIDQHSPDMILADYLLRDGSGHDVVRKARQHKKNSKVILMTAYAEKKMAIESVNLGVDHFLEKPFELDVLRKVMDDLLIQDRQVPSSFSLNERDLVVTWGTESARLTLKEFKILKFFMENEGLRMAREEIIEKIWPQENIGYNVFDTHMYNLKAKLPFFKSSLSVIRGKGYCYQVKK